MTLWIVVAFVTGTMTGICAISIFTINRHDLEPDEYRLTGVEMNNLCLTKNDGRWACVKDGRVYGSLSHNVRETIDTALREVPHG